MCRRQSGFTLVEVMVGLVIALIILGGAVYVFTGSAESSIYQMRSTRFMQQMRDAMTRMVTDVRRAGYIGYAYNVTTNTVSIENPFDYDESNPYPGLDSSMDISTTLTIGARTGEAANSCVLYAYNLDDDNPPKVDLGTTSIPSSTFDDDPNELYGFQLRVEGGVGIVYMRTGGGGAAFSCDAGDWGRITDPSMVDIESLSFGVAGSECRNVSESSRSDCWGTATAGDTTDDPISEDLLVEVRELRITMSGKSVEEPSLTFTLDQVVDLPNDRAYQVP